MRVLLLKGEDGKGNRLMKVGDDMLEQARTFYKDETLYEGANIQECIQWQIKQLEIDSELKHLATIKRG
jgi:hypothetical protein